MYNSGLMLDRWSRAIDEWFFPGRVREQSKIVRSVRRMGDDLWWVREHSLGEVRVGPYTISWQDDEVKSYGPGSRSLLIGKSIDEVVESFMQIERDPQDRVRRILMPVVPAEVSRMIAANDSRIIAMGGGDLRRMAIGIKFNSDGKMVFFSVGPVEKNGKLGRIIGAMLDHDGKLFFAEKFYRSRLAPSKLVVGLEESVRSMVESVYGSENL